MLPLQRCNAAASLRASVPIFVCASVPFYLCAHKGGDRGTQRWEQKNSAVEDAGHRMRVAPLHLLGMPLQRSTRSSRERDVFIDNLLVRIHLIVEIISVERPCARGVAGEGGACSMRVAPLQLLPLQRSAIQGYRVYQLGLGKRLECGVRIWGLRSRFWGLGVRGWGVGLRVEGLTGMVCAAFDMCANLMQG